MPVDIIQGADIVQAARMVPVIVGEENRVQVADSRPKHLLAEIRSGIYQDGPARKLHEDGTAQAIVPRVRRPAHLARTADDGHALRRPGSQKCQPCLHIVTSSMVPTRDASYGRSIRI